MNPCLIRESFLNSFECNSIRKAFQISIQMNPTLNRTNPIESDTKPNESNTNLNKLSFPSIPSKSISNSNFNPKNPKSNPTHDVFFLNSEGC